MEGSDPVRSIADLREDSRRAAREVAQEGLRPFILEAYDLADLHLTIRAGVVPTLPFPFLGTHQPTGFQPTENRYFVDPSFDPGDGLALTVQAFRQPLHFLKYLREGCAYAVLKAEQCYVQEYMPARTSEAVHRDAKGYSPLLAQVVDALQFGEEISDEVSGLFGSLEELRERLAQRMAFLREAEQHLRRGGDLSVAARKVVERIATGASVASDDLDTRPGLVIQSSTPGRLALNPNPIPEAN